MKEHTLQIGICYHTLELCCQTMESNITEKDCCLHHGKQTAGFLVNLLINILIVCVGTFYLIQFSQEQQSLKDLKIEVSSLKQVGGW